MGLTNSKSCNGRWSDLPTDITALIAARLHLFEFQAFRSVCKQWRLGSSSTSSSIPQTQFPWIMFYGYDECSNCSLYDFATDKFYFMQIPELKGAHCIASEQGWLLAHLDGHLFFFNIFSRAKIDLPDIKGFELSNHVATFSSPPTSKDCIVFVVINRTTPTTNAREINLCRHGSRVWERHICLSGPLFKTITCVKYIAKFEVLYAFDSRQMLTTYNPSNMTSHHHLTVVTTVNITLSQKGFLRGVIHRNSCIKEWLDKSGEETKIWISFCGSSVLWEKKTVFIPNEEVVYVHGRDDDTNDENKQKYHLNAVLVEPRFISLTENHSWFV
ncbi:F-box protein At1g49360-like [Tasmannia lanceolata]|uniref:F-box protein At1g49360-like n=1 Tax=Tasmannia lanceolata TaxID=3420 RepID=UPI004063F257